LKQSQDTQKEFEIKHAVLSKELAVLQEQKQSLETQLRQCQLDVQSSRAESTAKEDQLQQRLQDARNSVEHEIQRIKDMKSRSENDLAEARQQNADLQSRLANLQTKFESTLTPCIGHEGEIESLKSQLLGSAAELEELKKRTRSISTRYEKGDLVRTLPSDCSFLWKTSNGYHQDAEEKCLIKKIMEATQSIHDQEIALIRNELHRRDNLINSLQDAKVMLENSLAKHLQVEVVAIARFVLSMSTTKPFIGPEQSHPCEVWSSPNGFCQLALFAIGAFVRPARSRQRWTGEFLLSLCRAYHQYCVPEVHGPRRSTSWGRKVDMASVQRPTAGLAWTAI
jgi:hypothetical protein